MFKIIFFKFKRLTLEKGIERDYLITGRETGWNLGAPDASVMV